MTLASRLRLLIATAIIALGAIAGLGAYQLQKVFDAANYATVNSLPSIANLDKAALSFSKMRAQMWRHVVMDAAGKASLSSAIKNVRDQLTTVLDDYAQNNISSPKDEEMLSRDRAAVKKFDAIRDKVLDLSTQGKTAEAQAFLLESTSDVEIIDKTFEDHRAYNVELAAGYSAKAQNIRSFAVGLSAAIALAAMMALFAMGVLISRRVTGSINAAVSSAKAMADGDLTVAIDASSKDEMGQLMSAMGTMRDNLASIVGQVRSGTDAMATASAQISSGNMDLSSRTEQQASALEETASSMEEITGTVKQNADNARQASVLANNASESAADGGAVVAQVVNAMNSINESAKQAVDIIATIDGIAFQTNILALNAAVEAARAGEQGRGFAVVATEVRNLAQRSASAAKEIKTLIENSSAQARAGSALAAEAGSSMEKIVVGISRVTDVVSEISAASQEQSSGIEQVNQAVIHMDGATQQNAALVEEAAAASESLVQQASELASLVGRFKITEDRLAARAIPAKTKKLPPKEKITPAPRPLSKAAPSTPAGARHPRPPIKMDEGDWEEF